MSYSISDGTTTLTPALVLDYATSRQSRTLVHDVLGSGSPDVTLRPMATREGTLGLFCLTRSEAVALENLHLSGLPMTFTDPDAAPLRYVAYGAISLTYLSDVNRWRVDVGYREVTP